MKKLSLGDVSFVGDGLVRAECVLAHESGALVCSDSFGNGGVAIVHPDGRTSRVEATGCAVPLHPNGIALEPLGSVLLAQLGPSDGGIYRLYPDGNTEPVLLEIGGHAIPPTNFVLRDALDRIWVTLSTRTQPRTTQFRPDTSDGVIILIERNVARVVVDDVGFANEIVVDAERGLLFANETFARRICCFSIGPDGSLRDRRVIASFGEGVFPDGLSLDVDGGLWVTSVVSNRLIHVDSSGRQTVVLEDSDDGEVKLVEAAFQDFRMGREHLSRSFGKVLGNISSLAFGGEDRRTGYLGSLHGDRIATIKMPVAGVKPTHWTSDISGLLNN